MTQRVPLARIAIAIADHLIPLTPEQRDDAIARALILVDDDTDPDRPIPYKLADYEVVGTTRSGAKMVRHRRSHEDRHPVTACNDVPEPMLNGTPLEMRSVPVDASDFEEPKTPNRPSPRRVAQTRKAASAEIDATARSIVAVLSSYPNGLNKAGLANALNMDVAGYRFQAALRYVVNSGRIRATGVTNARRYFLATKGV